MNSFVYSCHYVLYWNTTYLYKVHYITQVSDIFLESNLKIIQ